MDGGNSSDHPSASSSAESLFFTAESTTDISLRRSLHSSIRVEQIDGASPDSPHPSFNHPPREWYDEDFPPILASGGDGSASNSHELSLHAAHTVSTTNSTFGPDSNLVTPRDASPPPVVNTAPRRPNAAPIRRRRSIPPVSAGGDSPSIEDSASRASKFIARTMALYAKAAESNKGRSLDPIAALEVGELAPSEILFSHGEESDPRISPPDEAPTRMILFAPGRHPPIRNTARTGRWDGRTHHPVIHGRTDYYEEDRHMIHETRPSDRYAMSPDGSPMWNAHHLHSDLHGPTASSRLNNPSAKETESVSASHQHRGEFDAKKYNELVNFLDVTRRSLWHRPSVSQLLGLHTDLNNAPSDHNGFADLPNSWFSDLDGCCGAKAPPCNGETKSGTTVVDNDTSFGAVEA